LFSSEHDRFFWDVHMVKVCLVVSKKVMFISYVVD
jgi:hypothetical protein